MIDDYEIIEHGRHHTVTAGWLRNYLKIIRAKQNEFGIVASKTPAITNPKVSQAKLWTDMMTQSKRYYSHEYVHYIIWEAVKEEWPPERWLYDK